MSAFSECFSNIRDNRDLTAAQIAEMCNEEVNLVFHWLNGKQLPGHWGQIACIVDKLQMSVDEVAKLKDAYDRTLLGEEGYQCNQKMLEILQVIQQRRDEYLSFQKDKILVPGEIKLPDFITLNNKIEILGWIQNVLGHLETQKEKKLYLKLQTVNPEVLMLLKMFCSHTEDCCIEEIVYLKEGKDSDIYNLEVIKGVIEILIQRNSVEVYSLQEMNLEKGFSDNWILLEDSILQFDEELSRGMVVSDSEWVTFFLEVFREWKESGRRLAWKVCEGDMADLSCEKREWSMVFKGDGFCVKKVEGRWGMIDIFAEGGGRERFVVDDGMRKLVEGRVSKEMAYRKGG